MKSPFRIRVQGPSGEFEVFEDDPTKVAEKVREAYGTKLTCRDVRLRSAFWGLSRSGVEFGGLAVL